MKRHVSRLAFALLAAPIAIAGGCSSGGGNPWGDYIHIVRQSLHGSFRPTVITREEAAKIPYASLGYRVDGGQEAILVLATDNNDEQLWTAASHVVLLTRNGRIVRSVGLPHDLGTTMAQGGGALPALADALRASYRSSRIVDLPDIGAYNVTLNCVTTARGPQAITIIGTVIQTMRVDETCTSSTPRWSFTDNFWLDSKTGFVWHAVQHLHPRGTTVQTEIFRPPG